MPLGMPEMYGANIPDPAFMPRPPVMGMIPPTAPAQAQMMLDQGLGNRGQTQMLGQFIDSPNANRFRGFENQRMFQGLLGQLQPPVMDPGFQPPAFPIQQAIMGLGQ